MSEMGLRARPVSGQATAPPSSVMKSRRPIVGAGEQRWRSFFGCGQMTGFIKLSHQSAQLTPV